MQNLNVTPDGAKRRSGVYAFPETAGLRVVRASWLDPFDKLEVRVRPGAALALGRGDTDVCVTRRAAQSFRSVASM